MYLWVVKQPLQSTKTPDDDKLLYSQMIYAYLAPMDIDTLKLLREVMLCRSFTDVAKARGIAPSSISRSIAGLETELGIRLFQRSTRKLEPTEAGLRYFERIAIILDEMESALLAALDVTHEPHGTLRVSTAVGFGQQMIVPLLPELAERFPALAVELILSDACLDLIDERIDVAIRLGTLQDSSYIVRELVKMKFYVCASPAYLERNGVPQTPAALRQHQCLLFPRTSYDLKNWLFRDANQVITKIAINGKYLINYSPAIKQCMLRGMGVALLPDWLVRQEVKQGQLIRLFSEYEVTATDFNSAVSLLYPSRQYLPLKVRVFNDFLIEKINL